MFICPHTHTHTRHKEEAAQPKLCKFSVLFLKRTHSDGVAKEPGQGRGGFGGRVLVNFSFRLCAHCALSNEFNSMSFQSFAQWSTEHTLFLPLCLSWRCQGETFYAIHSGSFDFGFAIARKERKPTGHQLPVPPAALRLWQLGNVCKLLAPKK